MGDMDNGNSRLGLVAIVGILIILVSSRLLVIMESSLNEGRGPELDQEAPTAVILLLVLILTMSYLLLSHFSKGFPEKAVGNRSLWALALTMFLIGMIIEPILPRPTQLFDSDAAGILLIIVPIAMIVAMFVPSGANEPQTAPLEEE